jgi:hypothetical protein
LEDIKATNEMLNEEKNNLRGKLLRFEKTTKCEDGKNTVQQVKKIFLGLKFTGGFVERN